MPYCYKCGNQNDLEDEYCFHCGMKQEKQEQIPVSDNEIDRKDTSK